VAATGVIFAAVYSLWAVQRAFTGEPDEENLNTPDIGAREIVTVVPLLALSLFLGFYPQPVLDRLDPAVTALVQHVEDHSDYKQPEVANIGPAELVAEQEAARKKAEECKAASERGEHPEGCEATTEEEHG
jgi:NADH-quinone oxidoreductase subunit M